MNDDLKTTLATPSFTKQFQRRPDAAEEEQEEAVQQRRHEEQLASQLVGMSQNAWRL